MKARLAKICPLLPFALILALASLPAFAQKQGFDLEDFYQNPFKDKEIFPQFGFDFETLKENYRDGFRISEEWEENQYESGKKKLRVRFSNEEMTAHYIASSNPSFLSFLSLLEIYGDKNTELKCGIRIGMTEGEITDICGKPSSTYQHEQNYELIYYREDYGQVNFSFGNKTKRLTAIYIHYGME